jgi:hypothetical protein
VDDENQKANYVVRPNLHFHSPGYQKMIGHCYYVEHHYYAEHHYCVGQAQPLMMHPLPL